MSAAELERLAAEEDAAGNCTECGGGHDEHLLLLCDSCNSGYHTCVTPHPAPRCASSLSPPRCSACRAATRRQVLRRSRWGARRGLVLPAMRGRARARRPRRTGAPSGDDDGGRADGGRRANGGGSVAWRPARRRPTRRRPTRRRPTRRRPTRRRQRRRARARVAAAPPADGASACTLAAPSIRRLCCATARWHRRRRRGRGRGRRGAQRRGERHGGGRERRRGGGQRGGQRGGRGGRGGGQR